MSRLVDELRKKHGDDPQALIAALGVDEAVIKDAVNEFRKSRGNPTLAHDSKETVMTGKTPQTQLARLTLKNIRKAVRPMLAQDAQVDFWPLIDGLTTKNFKERAPRILTDLRAALKGKVIAADGKSIAKDEEMHMGHVAQMLNHIEQTAEKGEPSLDESVSGPQHRAMMAAAEGHSNLGIPEKVGKEFKEKDKGKSFHDELPAFLKEKGMSEDDIKHVMDMMPEREPVHDEKEGEEELEQEREHERAVGDEGTKEDREKLERAEGEDRKMGKDEVDLIVKEALAKQREKTIALDEAREFVRPWVGTLPIAMDSARDVLVRAATMLGVKGATEINKEGLRALIERTPKPGAKPAKLGQDEGLAMDEAGRKKLFSKFPGLEKVGVGE